MSYLFNTPYYNYNRRVKPSINLKQVPKFKELLKNDKKYKEQNYSLQNLLCNKNYRPLLLLNKKYNKSLTYDQLHEENYTPKLQQALKKNSHLLNIFDSIRTLNNLCMKLHDFV